MVSEKARSFPWLMLTLVVAALFALALAGCGGDQSSSSSATESEAAAADEIAIPDDLAEAAETTKNVSMNADESAAEDLSKLPKEEDADVAKFDASDIEDGIEDQSKAPSGTTLVYTGGIQVLLPTSWNYALDPDGWNFATRDGQVWGGIYSEARSSSLSYNVEAMAASVPQILHESGADDIAVLNFDSRYSRSGTLCDSYILASATIQGQQYYCYYEYTLSKSYVNWMYFGGPAKSFKAHVDEIAGITDSLSYNAGEAI